MSHIVLYWHPMSSATPVACALAELGVAHERVKIDITAGEQRQPDYLALNPNGKVPTLTVDGAPMFEALAIELWLGHTYGVQSGLWPAGGTPAHLQAMSWSTWSYVTYGAQVFRLQAAKDMGTPGDAHGAAALKAVDELLTVLDGRLSQSPWLLGEAFTLVDLIVASVIGYSVYLGAPVAEHAATNAWLQKVQARPSMQIEA
ncbi:MAG TPA: glutathione S-transferase family protein [Hydrogenophaga sp.]